MASTGLLVLSILLLGACGTRSAPSSRGHEAIVRVPPTEAPATTPAPTARAAAAIPDCTVAFYGDSILHGGYNGTLRLDEPPAKTLKRLRPKLTIADYSENGETAALRAGRFAAQERRSRYVVIEHGINDAALGLPFEPSLLAMIAVAQGEGRTIILTGLSRQSVPIGKRARYDEIMRRVADRTGSAFADWGSVEFRKEDMADFLHPAKPYSDRLVERIASTLDAIAPQCAP